MTDPEYPVEPKSDLEDGQQGGAAPTPQCPSCGQYMGTPGHSCSTD